MQYTIATGLLTSLFAFACLIVYFARAHTFTFIGMHFSLGRLYTNALLVTLNLRRNLRATFNGTSIDNQPGGKTESIAFGSHITRSAKAYDRSGNQNFPSESDYQDVSTNITIPSQILQAEYSFNLNSDNGLHSVSN